MNTANPFKVGDLVSMRLSRVKMVRPPFFPIGPHQPMLPEPIQVITKVIARRVLKVDGDAVIIRLGGKNTAVRSSDLRLVY